MERMGGGGLAPQERLRGGTAAGGGGLDRMAGSPFYSLIKHEVPTARGVGPKAGPRSWSPMGHIGGGFMFWSQHSH